MNSEDTDSDSPAADRKASNLMRSQYYNVMVKVDEDVYCLDKLQLALKSDYFEKLFIEYTDQEECTLIELPVMDTDTFSTVVDMIYGQSLTSALNHDNYITLLMAMDYLQMEIDVETYANFVENISYVNVKIFRLYSFVLDNPNLQCLLPSVLEHLSGHLNDVQNNEDFLSLPFDHIVQIISRVNTDVFENEKREISEICSKWICHDLNNRLPLAAKLVNAAKRGFRLLDEIKDEDFNTILPDIAGKMMTKLFHKFLVCDGEVRVNPDPEKLLKNEEKKVPRRSAGENKRRRLIENNYFHDVVVRVGEKTYKLHRFMLDPECGYFSEIFSTENEKFNAESPNRQEYLLGDVDQTTFDMIVKYIYFDELQLSCETIMCVSKAAKILKMENLFEKCIWWMEANIEQVCEKIFIVDKCVSESWIRDNIQAIYTNALSEPEIGYTLPICLVSFDMLEDLLLSSSHCCNDPSKIVNLCSQWVFRDVQNRYHLIPQIALAINRNRNCRETSVPADLNDCSEQLIRDELWKTLRCTALVPSTNDGVQVKFHEHEIPVFVALTSVTSTIHVLNANLEQIASLCFSDSNPSENFSVREICLTATLIDDNLFIMLSLDFYTECLAFYVYNLCSKKFISLNKHVVVKTRYEYIIGTNKCSLLNCRGQVYCCFKDGHVLKYSVELNRWMMFSKKPIHSDETLENYRKTVWFTSDEDKLYRLYADRLSTKHYSSDLIYVVDEFNFQQNVWVSLPHLTFTRGSFEVENLTIIGDKLTVMLQSSFLSFDRNSRTWDEYSLTNNILFECYKTCFVLVRCENRLLHVFGNKLYEWSQSRRTRTWVLKKELPQCFKSPSDSKVNLGPYEYISAIHKRIVRSD